MSSPRGSRGARDTRCLPISSFQCPSLPSQSPCWRGRFSGESGCKDTTFFRYAKHFFHFFRKIFPSALCHSGLRDELFSRPAPAGAAKRGPRARFRAFSGGWRAAFLQVFTHRAVAQRYPSFLPPERHCSSSRSAWTPKAVPTRTA